MKKHLLPSLAIMLSATVLVSCSHDKKDKAGTELLENTIAVRAEPVSSLTTIGDMTVTGLLSTENDSKYGFKISGVISKVFVKEGQFFKKGQLLATLNPTEINANRDQAVLQLERARRDYNRINNLYKDSVNTLEQLQNAKTALDVAQKAVEITNFNQQYSKIYASSDGFVAQKMAGEGEVVQAGTPVLNINETNGGNKFTLKAGVTDREWAVIDAGQHAIVTLDGFPGKQFNAAVLRKSQAADNTGGAFEVEFKVDLGAVQPAVGMFGKAIIHNSQSSKEVVIPYTALVEADGSNAFVFTPVGNKVRRIPIVISGFDNDRVQVKSGLEQVKEIIVSNSSLLNEHSTIQIIK